MKIELLYFEGCPHFLPAFELLKKVLKEENADHPLETINVDSDSYAREIGFLGSPSIRINGKDIEEAQRVSTNYGIKCRIYNSPAGPTGLPPEELLRKTITEAKGEG